MTAISQTFLDHLSAQLVASCIFSITADSIQRQKLNIFLFQNISPQYYLSVVNNFPLRRKKRKTWTKIVGRKPVYIHYK